jgi:hypothetical protein
MGQSYVRQELDLATWGRPLFLFRGLICRRFRIRRPGTKGDGEAIDFLRTHMHFAPQALIIEGFNFAKATVADIEALRQVAKELDGELWMSAVTNRSAAGAEAEIPEPIAHLAQAFDVILAMQPREGVVHLRLLKDHDNPEVSDLHVALDPTTLLLIAK